MKAKSACKYLNRIVTIFLSPPFKFNFLCIVTHYHQIVLNFSRFSKKKLIGHDFVTSQFLIYVSFYVYFLWSNCSLIMSKLFVQLCYILIILIRLDNSNSRNQLLWALLVFFSVCLYIKISCLFTKYFLVWKLNTH